LEESLRQALAEVQAAAVAKAGAAASDEKPAAEADKSNAEAAAKPADAATAKPQAAAAASPAKPKSKYPPYTEVLKDTQKVTGLITLYRKDDRLLAELDAKNLNRDLIVLITIARGIGQTPIVGGFSWQFGDDAVWHRMGDLGTLQAGPMKLRLALHIERAGAGYTGKMDSLDQGANGIPLSAIQTDGAAARFQVPSVRGSFEGTVNGDSTEIAGVSTAFGTSVLACSCFCSRRFML
jgi:hypothetical protein